MNFEQLLATTIFLVAYGLMALQVMDKTRIALAGGALMLVLRLVDQHTAFHGTEAVPGIDWNTIFLLVGMMIIVGVTSHTGLFQWMGIKAAKIVRGHPLGVAISLSLVTAVASALLDNVTTVLLIAPIALVVTGQLGVDPVPYLVAIILASNIGGTATLIGDPPNIMIASAAGFGFMDFIKYDTPAVLMVLVAFSVALWVGLGPRIRVPLERRLRILALDEREAIRAPALLRKCLFVFGLTLVGFVIHSYVHLEPATIALAGASLLLVLLGRHPRVPGEEENADFHWYHLVEWKTIFFFIGVFIMVACLVDLGVIEALGRSLMAFTGGNIVTLTLLTLWFSAVASGIIGSIPFVATMNALILTIDPAGIHGLRESAITGAGHHPAIFPLWWALSLGACLGANFTVIGAAANVVVAEISADAGHPIDFFRFMKYGVPITLMSLVICTVYLWVLFLR
ncbi:MAG: ArsB/NhaD family transporter [Armatimonadetes bacterium]|nr:ArsB/NhaD family transporter [Armatimonadota bacterium]